MVTLNVFLFFSLPKRIHQQRNCWSIYGPLCLTTVATFFILADPLRHVLQDQTLCLGDLLAILCLLCSIFALIQWYTSYSNRNFGTVSGRRIKDSFKRHFARVAVFFTLVFTAVLLFICGHTKAGEHWSGAVPFEWNECGDNPVYSRVNATWTSECFWSSSQFHCTLPCCVPNPKYPHTSDELKACTCHCIPTEKEGMLHLSPMGVLFTIVFTYFGFMLLAIGTMWNANLMTKLSSLKDKWRQLRGR